MAEPLRTSIRTPASGSGTATPTASHGSQTILQTTTTSDLPSATLRLRAVSVDQQPTAPSEDHGRRIRWAEDVIDNEGMGKKSSKVCCIYHAPREPGNSDSDSSSSSSSSDDSDSEPDLSRAQPAGGRRGRGRKGGSKGDKGKGGERKPSPNAYERQPKQKDRQAG